MIYYTTDGTEPTEDSKAIIEGSPLTINGNNSIVDINVANFFLISP